MNRIVTTSTVGTDGILHLDLPVGMDQADKEVQVTVEPMAAKKAMTQEEWRSFVLRTAGSITDPTFERPNQGELQEREPMP